MSSIFGSLNITTVLVIAVSVCIQIAYLWFCYGRTRRFTILLGVFLSAGAASALSAAVINGSLIDLLHISDTTESVYFAPTVEESLKFAWLLLAVRIVGYNIRQSSVRLAGMGVGTTFMLIERITKATIANLGLALTILEQIPVHSITTGLTSTSIRSKRLTAWIAVTLPVAIGIHTSFNYSLTVSPSLSAVYLLLLAEIIAYWIAFLVMGRIFQGHRDQPTMDSTPAVQ